MTNVPKAVLSLLLGAVSAPFLHVASAAPSDWFGLWRAVDPLDGGVITLSVSGGDDADGVNLRFSDTFIRACTSVPSLVPDEWMGAGHPASKRGIYLAEATVVGDKLTSPDGESDEVPVQIYCFAGPDDKDKVPDGSPGVQANAEILWTFKYVGGSIVMSGTLFSGESALKPNSNSSTTAGGDLTVRFHRESTAQSPGGWTGMYAGVDPLDGGLITLSVSGGGGDDGAVDLRFSDTQIRACTSVPGGLPEGWNGAGTPDSKRGIYLADAKADGAKLVSVAGDETVPIQIYCFAGPGDEVQPGVEFQTDVSWTFTENDNGYFIMSGTLFSGENSLVSSDGSVANGGDNAVRFHKIAEGGATEEGTSDHDHSDHAEEGEGEDGVADEGAGDGAAEEDASDAAPEDEILEDGTNGSARFLATVATAGTAVIALFFSL